MLDWFINIDIYTRLIVISILSLIFMAIITIVLGLYFFFKENGGKNER